VKTKDGIESSEQTLSINVPGAIPVPSGLVVLGMGITGLIGFWARRR
jgi:hypothetical protein